MAGGGLKCGAGIGAADIAAGVFPSSAARAGCCLVGSAALSAPCVPHASPFSACNFIVTTEYARS